MSVRFSLTRGPPLRKAAHCSTNKNSNSTKNKKKTLNITDAISKGEQESQELLPPENIKTAELNQKRDTVKTNNPVNQRKSKEISSKKKKSTELSIKRVSAESEKQQNKTTKPKLNQSSQSKIQTKSENVSQAKKALAPTSANNLKCSNKKPQSQIVIQQTPQNSQRSKQQNFEEADSFLNSTETGQACPKTAENNPETIIEPKISIDDLIQNYYKIAQEYKRALGTRQQLREQQQQLQHQIADAYSEQSALEKEIMETAKMKFSMTNLFS